MESSWLCIMFLKYVALIYSCVQAQPVVMAEPATSVVGHSYQYQPWYKAWYEEEIESDLANLGFNATLCPAWYKHIPQERALDYQYAMEVGELCDRLSENRADYYEAEREYQWDLKKRKALRDSLVDLIVKLSNHETEKIEQLTARDFPLIEEGDAQDSCYWPVYRTYSEACVDPEMDPNVKKYRRVFANACAQSWLDVDTICEQIRQTCNELKLRK